MYNLYLQNASTNTSVDNWYLLHAIEQCVSEDMMIQILATIDDRLYHRINVPLEQHMSHYNIKPARTKTLPEPVWLNIEEE